MEELTTLSQEETGFDCRTHCIWCRQKFGPNRKKSQEHILLDSLGSNFKLPLLCEFCNKKLGNKVDKYLYKDFWTNRAKSRLKHLGVKELKIHPKFVDDGRLEKMAKIYLQDGKPRLVPPETDKKPYRVVGKISLMVTAIGLENLIFDSIFDDLKKFVERGKPNLAQITGSPKIAIYRTYFNRDTKPQHIVEFVYKNPWLSISVSLFNSYGFITFIRLDRDLKVRNFRIVQFIHPEKKVGLFLENESGKFEFMETIEGKFIL